MKGVIEMKVKYGSKYVLVCLLALIVTFSLMLGAFGPSAEDVIRGKLTEEFDQLKAG